VANTIREQIISAYKTRLAQITVANGYNTGLGANVYRGVKHVDVDALILWPQPENVTSRYGENVCAFSLRIEGVMAFGSTDPGVIQEKILGDIIKCVTDPSVTVSALPESVKYITGGPADQPDAKDTITGAFAEFEIKYKTLLGNPYQQ